MLVLALVLCLSLISGLTGCTGLGAKTVAATVNDEEILESTITDRIMAIRNQTASYSEDATWATALKYEDWTPETLREAVIRDAAFPIVIRLEAAAQGFIPDYETIDKDIQQAKTIIGGDTKTWNDALKRRGFANEAEFRADLEFRDVYQQMREAFVVEPTAEELEEYVLDSVEWFFGKRSSAMYFSVDDEDAIEQMTLVAQEIVEKLLDGATFSALISEYSAASGSEESDGDMGWDALSYFDDEYYKALDELSLGEAAYFFNDKDELYIILCTEEFGPAEDGTVAFADVPEIFVDLLKDYWLYLNEDNKFSDSINKIMDGILVINPMPKNLPYDVNMDLAGDIPETPSEDYSASEPEAVAAAIMAGLQIEDVIEGEGDLAEPGSKVYALYTGYFADGTVFDSSSIHGGTPISFILGAKKVIAGWDAGVVGMRVGGMRRLIIPASLAYGAEGRPGIPPYSVLYFDIMLVQVDS